MSCKGRGRVEWYSSRRSRSRGCRDVRSRVAGEGIPVVYLGGSGGTVSEGGVQDSGPVFAV